MPLQDLEDGKRLLHILLGRHKYHWQFVGQGAGEI